MNPNPLFVSFLIVPSGILIFHDSMFELTLLGMGLPPTFKGEYAFAKPTRK